MGQLLFGYTCHSLEIIMAGIAEVRGAKAEENSHWAAVPAFILKEVCAVLGTHLLGWRGDSKYSVIRLLWKILEHLSVLEVILVCILDNGETAR